MSETIESVLEFWLGELGADGRASPEMVGRWWRKSDAFDQEIRDRFLSVHAAIANDQLEGWHETPRGRLAYVIVLDQFSRNMFRDTPQMYAEDKRCQRVALEGYDDKGLSELRYHERYFLFMPMMHAEDIELQRRGVELFASLERDFPGNAEGARQAMSFMRQHHDIVERFGRFPHRNKILGRETTAEEAEFLSTPGSSF
ncbi:MAG TPA: DUF924 domain-containing protein [Polyangiaceae bacterium]|nr:DUF924 domain-containing protein [Polyangiaceae bacterium]